MAQVPQTTIDTLAAAVYESCLKAPSDQLFSISELQGMVPGKNNLEVTQRVLNELLRTRSLSALTQGNQTVFKAAARDYADKYVSTPTTTTTTLGFRGSDADFLSFLPAELRICLATKKYSTGTSKKRREKESGQRH